MTTGIEFVGLILAIVPLCLAALEHQETATRPYKTLFRYQMQYAQCVEDLGLYLVELHQTVRLVFRTAGISDDDHFNEVLRNLNAGFWNDTTKEEKLIAHFGDSQYALGFRNIMKRISKDVWKIWEFLDLDDVWDVRNSTDTDVWLKIKSASELSNSSVLGQTPSSPPSELFRGVRKRAKLIFRSPMLRKTMQNLGRNIERLSDQAMRTRTPDSATPIASSPERPLSPAVTAIARQTELYARCLYEILQSAQLSCRHVSNCFNLQVGPKHGISHSNAPFTLAYASHREARSWKIFDVRVLEGNSVSMPDSSSSSYSPFPERESGDLCDLITRPNNTRLESEMCLDTRSRMLKRIKVTGEPGRTPFELADRRRVSVKSLLRTASKSSASRPLLSKEQSVSLGLTVISTFLQLFATEWLSDSWCSEDVFCLSPDTSTNSAVLIDVEQMFVAADPRRHFSMVHRSTADVRSRFLKLAIMLLEISRSETIESYRRSEHYTADEQSRDFVAAYVYLRDPDSTIQHCFRSAIEFCLACWTKLPVDVDMEHSTRQEFLDQVLTPFQRGLREITGVEL